MNVFHALWIPSRTGFGRGGLFLWGESGAELQKMARKKGLSKRHPFLLREEAAFAGFAGAYAPNARLRKARMPLLLPAAGGLPVPSSRILHAQEPGKSKISLRKWPVDGFFLDSGDLEFFLALPKKSGVPGTTFGSSLLFWSACMRFCVELACRQRVLPALAGVRGIWQPVFSNPSDAGRLAVLKEGVPPSCRCAYRQEGRDTEILDGSFLVDDFISFFINKICRKSLERENFQLMFDSGSLSDRWMKSLASANNKITGDETELAALHGNWAEWAGREGTATTAGFRTCFRLEPPDGSLEGYGSNAKWRLQFLLQNTEDPSLLVPYEDAWSGQTQNVAMPHEQMLSDLGYASTIFPPLERSLKERFPAHCELGTGDAHAFLKHASALVEDSGFGVFLPSFWLQKKKLGIVLDVRSRTKEAGGDNCGLFGAGSVLEFDWRASLGGETLDSEEFHEIAQLKIPLVNVRGQWIEVDGEDLKKTVKHWSAKKYLTPGELIVARASDRGLPVCGITTPDNGLNDFLKLVAEPEKLEELPQPNSCTGTLRPYQIRGFSWLNFMLKRGIGVCLADDMGLGKTIQMIAYLLSRKERGGPALLICPTSMVGNWEMELRKFAPCLKFAVHHGVDREKGNAFVRNAQEQDIVISTYALAHRDEAHLSRINWHLIILDEAQNIKNPYAKQTSSIFRLNALQRVALTGTPVENRLSELWSVFNFMNPGLLGSWNSFREEFAAPIEKYSDDNASKRLREIIRPFVLRRLKTDKKIIADLPDKREIKVYSTLTKEQASLYQAIVDDAIQKLDSCEGIERRGIILATLTKLKQVCNHPVNFLKDRGRIEGRSGKTELLEGMIEEVLANKEKCLLFSQYREMGSILQAHISEKFNEEVLFLHGGVDRGARQEMISRFQGDAGPSLFVLSLKAGGTGINLTKASRVFHYDRWWNPAIENQATDRAFRIGQTKNVFVYKFICRGTIEEKIDGLMEKKKDLADRIVGSGEQWLTELSTEQLKELFTLEAGI